jgi:dihydrofolate reductase
MRLTVHTFLSLDGVMQGPGSPEEDPSGGFTHGGWVVPYASDHVFGEIVTSWFARAEALLFGRLTFDLMRAFWPQVTDPADPVAHALNTLPKYVVSSTLTEPGWEPTTILTGDAVDAVARLKELPGGELQVHGCARLAASLHAAGLIDEYRLLVFPVTVGAGKRLFTPDAPPSGFRLLETRPTPSGAVYSVLEPAPFTRGDITVEDGVEVTSLVD